MAAHHKAKGRVGFTFGKLRLMRVHAQTKLHFQKYPFTKSIEIVPTACLTPGGGFENLEQLRALLPS